MGARGRRHKILDVKAGVSEPIKLDFFFKIAGFTFMFSFVYLSTFWGAIPDFIFMYVLTSVIALFGLIAGLSFNYLKVTPYEPNEGVEVYTNGFMAFVIATLLGFVFSVSPVSQSMFDSLYSAGGWVLSFIFIVGIAYPEELWFRGALLPFSIEMCRILLPPFVPDQWKVGMGIGIQGIAFGWFHLVAYAGSLPMMLNATISGIVYGYFVLRSKRLSTSILAHGFHNTMALINTLLWGGIV